MERTYTGNPDLPNVLTLLKKIPDLNVDYAIGAVGGSLSLYEKTLKQMVRLFPVYIEQMEQCLNADKDLDIFAIKVHGIRGTLRQVGSTRLADTAEILEKAAKAGDREYCGGHYGAFKAELQHFLLQVDGALQADRPETDGAAAPAGNMSNAPKRILVVDDNPANLTVINGILNVLYKVYPVDSGDVALKFLEKQRPDLILLDIEMPDMSGTDLFHIIKGNPAFTGIPVIFLTAHNDSESEAKAFVLGAADFIHKPVNDVILLARVKMHLELASYRNAGLGGNV